MQINISPNMRTITISTSNGFLDFMKIKVAARHISYRTIFHTMLILAFLLPFIFILTAVVTLEGVNKCSSLDCLGRRLGPRFLVRSDDSTKLVGDLYKLLNEVDDDGNPDLILPATFGELVSEIKGNQYDAKTIASKLKGMKNFLQKGTWALLLFLGFVGQGLAQQTVEATVRVRGTSLIGETDDNFICATLDWWPPDKCNYGHCPWRQTSVLNLDLKHPLLANAIKAFGNLRIRIGGTLQDQVQYDVEGVQQPCLPFRKEQNGLFGFSKGCLKKERWDELNQLFDKTGAIVTFGLNALTGRHQVSKGALGGTWNTTNAFNFIKYTVTKGYKIDSWEFGNELSGSGVGTRVAAQQYAQDLVNLKSILKELYSGSTSEPLLLAPGGFFDRTWYTQLLQDSGPNVVDALTHHIYNLGAGVDPNLVSRILDPNHADLISKTFVDLQLVIQNSGSWASAWVGEAGGAYNSGGDMVSNTFVNSFWYLDQLGMASMYNTKVYCRQALIGGYYSLLNTSTFVPNPDYYSALLWNKLMGKGALATKVVGSQYLRAYAHCSKEKAGITVLLINLNRNTTFTVNIENDMNINLHLGQKNLHRPDSLIHRLKKKFAWVGKSASSGNGQRYEYHLTPKDGNLRSQSVLLNGQLLELSDAGEVPLFDPMLISASSNVTVSPLSIAFVILPSFESAACS